MKHLTSYLLALLLLPLSARAATVGIDIPDVFSSPVTVSLDITSARTQDRVFSLLQREARTTMRNACNDLSDLPEATYTINGRIRRLRFTYRVESMDVSISRDDAIGYSGTANIVYTCLVR